MHVREVNSGAACEEPARKYSDAHRCGSIDLVLVWRLDRWERSVNGSTGDVPGTGASLGWGLLWMLRSPGRCAESRRYRRTKCSRGETIIET